MVKVGTKPTVKKEGNKTTTTTYKLDKEGNVIVDKVTVKEDQKTEPNTPQPQPKSESLAENAGKVHPQTKSLLESGLASTRFVNTGADLANNLGMRQLTQIDDKKGIQVFGAVGSSDFLTEKQDYLDVRGGHVLVGVGKQFNNKAGKLHTGVYVEGGSGKYDSLNKFANNPSVRAEGDTKYVGVGGMLQQQFDNNLIAEAGVRLGETDTNYNSNDLQDSTGYINVNYDVKRKYTGAHVGLGYQVDINDKLTATPSAKLLYTNIDSAEKLIEGSTFKFDAINSFRSQLGTDVSYKVTDKTDVYTNAVWEREYQGDADGSVLGLDMVAPSLKGNTGIVGAGVHFNPREDIDINMDVKGKFGKQEGGEVGMSVKYTF